MAKLDHKSLFFRFAAALAVVLFFGALFLPAVAETLQTSCDDDCGDCDDHCESACGCIGYPPVTLGYVIPLSDNSPTLYIQCYSIITPSIDIEFEFLDRVDRPPQTLL